MSVIRFLLEHHGFREGQDVEMGSGPADIYVSRGVAQYVEKQDAAKPPVEKPEVKTRDIPGPKDPRSNR